MGLQWQCHQCTYLHRFPATKCTMCCAPRKEEQPPLSETPVTTTSSDNIICSQQAVSSSMRNNTPHRNVSPPKVVVVNPYATKIPIHTAHKRETSKTIANMAARNNNVINPYARGSTNPCASSAARSNPASADADATVAGDTVPSMVVGHNKVNLPPASKTRVNKPQNNVKKSTQSDAETLKLDNYLTVDHNGINATDVPLTEQNQGHNNQQQQPPNRSTSQPVPATSSVVRNPYLKSKSNENPVFNDPHTAVEHAAEAECKIVQRSMPMTANNNANCCSRSSMLQAGSHNASPPRSVPHQPECTSVPTSSVPPQQSHYKNPKVPAQQNQRPALQPIAPRPQETLESSNNANSKPMQIPPMPNTPQKRKPRRPRCPEPPTAAENPFNIAKRATFEPGPVLIDSTTSHNYIYPVNPSHPVRTYQQEITRTALFHNTLVSLPTGLGKTLIAAVVMYNYRRWFSPHDGKVVFCAPTRPLVSQQIKACYQIMGIPTSDTAEISGKTRPDDRIDLWKERHLFFCTPQTLVKDLEEGRLDGKKIVCLVLDEAHKAKGNYDYVKMIPLLEDAGARMRIVGLSATPGTCISSIQEVIKHLRVSKIEVRLEDDADVQKYVHDRQMEVIRVKTNAAVTDIEGLWRKVVNPILDKLRSCNALCNVRAGNSNISAYCVMLARDEWKRRNPGDQSLDGLFIAANNLVGISSDLRVNGVGIVKTKILRLMNQKRGGYMSTIWNSKEFKEAWAAVLAATDSKGENVPGWSGDAALKMNNPKLEKLEEVLVEHFERKLAVGESTRAIVFSQFRDAVEEIVKLLGTRRPLLKPSKFVGQGRASGAKSENASFGTVGMKQWEQQKAIQEFRTGVINVLVCTCIGEEGLDIGEVDLIVNFDCLRSPIRMIQRFGRTGRKRDGRVICLVAEGPEEQRFHQSGLSSKTLGRALKKIDSFRLCPSTPLFRTDKPPPKIHEQEMNVKEEYRLSQVGGHARSNVASAARSAEPFVDPNKWRLTLTQEEDRRREFGERTRYFESLASLAYDVNGAAGEKCVLFSHALRRKYLRARPDLDRHKSMGIARRILKTVHDAFLADSPNRPNTGAPPVHRFRAMSRQSPVEDSVPVIEEYDEADASNLSPVLRPASTTDESYSDDRLNWWTDDESFQQDWMMSLIIQLLMNMTLAVIEEMLARRFH